MATHDLSSPSIQTNHLVIDGVSHSYPDRRVLTDVNLVVPAGARVCLVGENGSGKTTLLKIVAGIEKEFEGRVDVPGESGLFHQELPFPEHCTIREVVDDAMAKTRQAKTAVTDAATRIAHDTSKEALVAYEKALNHAEGIEAWMDDVRADQIMEGLGLNSIPVTRRVSELSGGQKARLSLAWLLIDRPHTLLLDEPTNHLDDGGVALLRSLVTTWTGPVIIASHDRSFLDDVATTIADLDPAPARYSDSPVDNSPGSGIGLTTYTGTYSDYLNAKKDERLRWEKQYRDEQEELAELRARVTTSRTPGKATAKRSDIRMGVKYFADRNATSVSRQTRNAERVLEQRVRTQVRKPPAPLTFAGLPTGKSVALSNPHTTLISGTHLAKPGRLQPVSLTVRQDTRLLITGNNGAGKSTLLHILAGTIRNHDGRLTHPRTLTRAILGQDIGKVLQTASPDWQTTTVADLYQAATRTHTSHTSTLSEQGLIAPRDMSRPIASLSQGQQRRLELAILLATPPQLLLLDEPTNHFSLPLVTTLEETLPTYPGAVIIASHDQWLRDNWDGDVLHLDPQRPYSQGA